MAFKDILLHMDDSPQCLTRLDLAISLAQKHKANLTGLYVTCQPLYVPQKKGKKRKADAAEALFKERTSQAGIKTLWQRVDSQMIGTKMSDLITLQAYYHDLVIVGQTDQHSSEYSLQVDLPERVILGSGRAVMVVPYAVSCNTVGERVMVAWNAGRESARAVNDALPILVRAKQVEVLTIAITSNDVSEDNTSFASVCAHLEHHNVKVRSEQVIAAKSNIGDLLLNLLSDEGVDLLVMGAFKQSKRSSLALGPVAKHLLKYSSVPLLMSH
jgi:nucleotide-binding universal stress UspA family protein